MILQAKYLQIKGYFVSYYSKASKSQKATLYDSQKHNKNQIKKGLFAISQ
jgi:hypothetical protein